MMTVKEAADALGISQQRVRILLRDKRLKAAKVGKEWAIKSIKVGPSLKPNGRPRKVGA